MRAHSKPRIRPFHPLHRNVPLDPGKQLGPSRITVKHFLDDGRREVVHDRWGAVPTSGANQWRGYSVFPIDDAGLHLAEVNVVAADTDGGERDPSAMERPRRHCGDRPSPAKLQQVESEEDDGLTVFIGQHVHMLLGDPPASYVGPRLEDNPAGLLPRVPGEDGGLTSYGPITLDEHLDEVPHRLELGHNDQGLPTRHPELVRPTSSRLGLGTNYAHHEGVGTLHQASSASLGHRASSSSAVAVRYGRPDSAAERGVAAMSAVNRTDPPRITRWRNSRKRDQDDDEVASSIISFEEVDA